MDWIRDYEEDSLPVLNSADQLVGVLTVQDILDYREEESREVYNKLAGISEGTENDLDEPLLLSMKKRLPWLIILLFLGMFVSSVVGMFEQVVAQIAILVCFQSLILDMAGNVGTQSLAVTIRVLTDESLPISQKLHLISKEVRVGLTNGALLGCDCLCCSHLLHHVPEELPAALFHGGGCLRCHCAGAGHDHFQLCRNCHSHGI